MSNEDQPYTDAESALALELTGCWPENECWDECHRYWLEQAREQLANANASVSAAPMTPEDTQ